MKLFPHPQNPGDHGTADIVPDGIAFEQAGAARAQDQPPARARRSSRGHRAPSERAPGVPDSVAAGLGAFPLVGAELPWVSIAAVRAPPPARLNILTVVVALLVTAALWVQHPGLPDRLLLLILPLVASSALLDAQLGSWRATVRYHRATRAASEAAACRLRQLVEKARERGLEQAVMRTSTGRYLRPVAGNALIPLGWLSLGPREGADRVVAQELPRAVGVRGCDVPLLVSADTVVRVRGAPLYVTAFLRHLVLSHVALWPGLPVRLHSAHGFPGPTGVEGLGIRSGSHRTVTCAACEVPVGEGAEPQGRAPSAAVPSWLPSALGERPAHAGSVVAEGTPELVLRCCRPASLHPAPEWEIEVIPVRGSGAAPRTVGTVADATGPDAASTAEPPPVLSPVLSPVVSSLVSSVLSPVVSPVLCPRVDITLVADRGAPIPVEPAPVPAAPVPGAPVSAAPGCGRATAEELRVFALIRESSGHHYRALVFDLVTVAVAECSARFYGASGCRGET